MLDPISSFWILVWTSLTSYGLYLLITGDQRTSVFYVYGKSLNVNKRKGLFWNLFLVPKKFFTHFYLVSLCVFVPSLLLAITYYYPSSASTKIRATASSLKGLSKDFFTFEAAQDLDQIVALVFTLILMIVQCTRRLYECLFISVYSDSSKINIIHYVFGHTFYLFAALSTLCPIIFSQTSNKFSMNDLIDNLLNKQRAILFTLFIYASHHQHKCHLILANLRKDKTGRVISQQHYVPTAGLFQYVTCPHFLLETILYFIIIVIQNFKILYWNLIFLLVLSTQTINALTEHDWYKRKYKDYPKERRAIFPRLL